MPLRPRLRAALPLAGVLAFAFAVGAPLLSSPGAISPNDDWTQIFAFQAYLEDSLLRDGELPERSHMLGSGFPLPAHPEYPIISPLTPSVLLFGAVLGTKINVLLVLLAGVLGMWLLTRRVLQLPVGPAVWACVTLAACGWFPAILASGNYPEIVFLLLPLLAFLVFEGRLLPAAILGATMLLDGHLNTVVCFVMLAVWAALRGRRDLGRFAAAMAATAGLAAYKLVPTIALLRIEDRAIESGAAALEVAPFDLGAFVGLTCRADGFALGPLPWLLAALGGLALWRRAWRLGALLILALLLMGGPHAPLDLFALLRRLPVLRSIDAPSKYFVFCVGFFAILLGAHALSSAPRRWARAACVAAIALTIVPLWWANRGTLAAVFTEPDVPPLTRRYVQVDTEYFVQGEWRGPPEARPDLYVYYRQGLGIVRWEDNFQLPSAAVPALEVTPDGYQRTNPDYRGEAWLGGAGSATVEIVSANTVQVAYDAASDDVLTINQRWDDGWGCDGGVPVDRAGLLAVSVPAGAGTIRCGYASAPLRWGGLVSALTLLALLALTGWRRTRRPASASPAPSAPDPA